MVKPLQPWPVPPPNTAPYRAAFSILKHRETVSMDEVAAIISREYAELERLAGKALILVCGYVLIMETVKQPSDGALALLQLLRAELYKTTGERHV